MSSGVIEDADAPVQARVVSSGRPPWWAIGIALVVGCLVTADLLTRGWLLHLDLSIAHVIGGWGLRHSSAYPFIWVVTQLGGRVTILVVLAALVAHLAWRRRTWLPLIRILVGLGLLTLAVYAIKQGVGRTAPGYHGVYFFRADGASFPSGHVANAVLMWGIARWQAVEYGLPARVQRASWWLSVVGPVATAAAMVSLNFHWVTDAVVGGCVGVVLLGVVHALDAMFMSRWVRARAGRQTA